MNDTRGTEPTMTLRQGMWNHHQWLVSSDRARPTDINARMDALEDEMAIRQLLAMYSYFYDSKELDRLMDVFTKDCVLVNPRGTYVGREAIRSNYEYLMSLTKISFHRPSNVVVKIAEDRSTAWASSYLLDLAVELDGAATLYAGTFADRVSRTSEGWRIAERRITVNIRQAMPLIPSAPHTAPPKPSSSQTSVDLTAD